MKIAHLILAHKNPLQVLKLLNALRYPGSDFFIHVDKKASEEDFVKILKAPDVFFIKKRISVGWGCYSLVQAELNGMEEIVSLGGYDYLNIISGQDFPLRSAKNIHDFFVDNNGTEFISCVPYSENDEWWRVALPRITHYSFHNWRIPGKFRLQFLFNRIFPKKRIYPLNHTVAGKSQWFSISLKSAAYILDFLKTHPEIVRYYKYVWGADEFIFSTILYNSPFRNQIKDHLMYTDWSEGKANPKTFLFKDFDQLIHTDKLFARKFDLSLDPTILSSLEEWIKSAKQLY